MLKARLIAIGLLLSASCAAMAQPAPASGTATPQPAAAGKTFRDCADVCPRMVHVPGGAFQMGGIPTGTERHNIQPIHAVTLGAFAIGQYEVTRGEYAAFVRDSGRPAAGDCEIINSAEVQEKSAAATWQKPGFPQGDEEPVTCVSWDDAKAYVAWLSKKTSRPYRLLSESEWEYAARGGTTSKFWWGEDPTAGCAYANGADQSAKQVYTTWIRAAACNDGHAFTAPAGSYPPNGFGVHDMAGNVWEWVEDCFEETYDPQPRDGAAYTGGTCTFRVNRGGSWYNGRDGLRSVSRDNTLPTGRANKVGFRVARTN